MHILILPSFYPDEFNPILGSFFEEQVRTLAEQDVLVNVVYVEQLSLRKLNFHKVLKNHFQSAKTARDKWTEYRIKGWKMPWRIGTKIWIFLSFRLVEKYLIWNGKPDLIHVHNIFWAGVVAEKIFRKYKIPFLITEHSSEFLRMDHLSHRERVIALNVYSNAVKIITVSKSLRRAIERIKPDLVIDIIPNVVDTNFFTPNKKKLDNENTIKFLAIGNLNRNKGHALLIDAFYEAFRSNKAIVLDICGDGSEKTALIKKIHSLNLEKEIKLLGSLNKLQILEKLRESDCLVLSSYFETFGVVLIEAMSCGVPFITTKCGGPEDIYQPEVGLIVESGNVRLLAQAMLDFIAQRKSFSISKLRSVALNKYSKQKVYEQLMVAYSLKQ